jgi:hypothetical protein
MNCKKCGKLDRVLRVFTRSAIHPLDAEGSIKFYSVCHDDKGVSTNVITKDQILCPTCGVLICPTFDAKEAV